MGFSYADQTSVFQPCDCTATVTHVRHCISNQVGKDQVLQRIKEMFYLTPTDNLQSLSGLLNLSTQLNYLIIVHYVLKSIWPELFEYSTLCFKVYLA